MTGEMNVPHTNILVYDGDCGICSSSVRYLLKNSKDRLLQAIPLQSEKGRQILADAGLDAEKVDSLVYFNEKGFHRKSDAVLELTKKMHGLFPYLNYLRFIPRRIRNSVYDFIARNRHRFDGLLSGCEVPFQNTNK